MQLLQPNNTRLAFIGVLFLGLLIRLWGISWGLTDPTQTDIHPLHPDEESSYAQSFLLYDKPDSQTFTWGGALYYRLAYLARWLSHDAEATPAQNMAAALLSLRLLNVFLAGLTALVLGRLASRLLDDRLGILVMAFFLFLPVHTLECHYARPDVLLVFWCSVSLLFSIQSLLRRQAHYAFWAALFGGLALSTMAWGIITIIPIFVAFFEMPRAPRPTSFLKQLMRLGLLVVLGLLVGYLLGSFESFYFRDAFRWGQHRAQAMHEGFWTFPFWNLATSMLYAFGLPITLLGYGGLACLFLGQYRAKWTLTSYLLGGLLLLGFKKEVLMRNLLTLVPFMVISAAVALNTLAQKWPKPKIAQGLAWITLLFTFQISAGYVVPLEFGQDIRYRAADWLLEYGKHHAPGQSLKIGLTKSFYGDWTFLPHFPAQTGHQFHLLMLKEDYDIASFVHQGLDFIILADYPLKTANTAGLRLWRELNETSDYAMIATFRPPFLPLTLLDWLPGAEPGDLLILRPTLMIFQRKNRFPTPPLPR